MACPSCGYVSEHIEKPTDPRTVEVVNSPEYQTLLKSPDDDTLRRLRLAILLDRATEELLGEVCHWRVLSWRRRELGRKAEAEEAADALTPFLTESWMYRAVEREKAARPA